MNEGSFEDETIADREERGNSKTFSIALPDEIGQRERQNNMSIKTRKFNKLLCTNNYLS